ncbi:carbon monoxide dehydrogenase [Metabacillus litoralis]|uniref:carbon monoxide dehydrogenase n=1 Tax=Metabacillus litoralis TaxID=152268 RepID=UPI00203DCD52|nr:carbon monoxide dehydrogenase [Metabacillus litoralis]MCM3160814.1 carbon monoxide dehydrogenase [Metabacillus litoralis]
MNKRVSILMLLLSFLICVTGNVRVSANTNNTQPPLEEMYTQNGYKPVEEAVIEFEKHFKKDVKLPFIVPPIPFTHQFGIFTKDKEYGINDSLNIEFINEKSPENHYKIDIRPLKTKITIKDSVNQKTYTLKDGKEAIFFVEQNVCFFVFEKDKWQYMLGINKRLSNKTTEEMFVAIANSIDYVPKKEDH